MKLKILFSGGGTLGPVTPLLAIHSIIKNSYTEAEFVWYGTKKGPEKEIILTRNISFFTFPTAKLRRYLSPLNFVDIFRFLFSFFKACWIIWKDNPNVCISAGGYTSVPLHWAAWLFGVPTWVHQQDVKVGLAVKLMAPFAKVITTSLEDHVAMFDKKKTLWLGNPIRENILLGKETDAKHIFNLTNKYVILAMGGGTGSARVNQLILEAMPHLKGMADIIHVYGKQRPSEMILRATKQFDHYKTYPFLDRELKHAYKIADLVIGRGGFGTLSELGAMSKPAIIVPKPGHQEENVRFLERAEAIALVSEKTTNGLHLAALIKDLLLDEKKRKQMGNNLHKKLPPAKSEDIKRIFDSLI